MKNLNEIKDFKELNLRQTFRAHIIYEQIMGKSFSVDAGLNGTIVLFYSHILGSNKDVVIDYDEFMDWLDANPKMLSEFTEWYLLINGAKIKPENEEGPAEKKSTKQTKTKKV